LNLGHLDSGVDLAREALGVVEEGSKWETALCEALGIIYFTQGKLDEAEGMHKKALAIDDKLERIEGLASDYGNLLLCKD
jgi:tetratricopeptide (TPR) repeat protein